MIYEDFKNIRDFCNENLKKIELWPYYYNRRYVEFLSYYDVLPKKEFENVLELGCGMGYNTAFLSKISKKIIATDLEYIDPITHSPGLQITRDFLKELNITNVDVMHASAEELPFPDNSFDMVISVHVLEHIPNREKAILEINRVLKKDGINFCVVPTRTDRVYAFFNNYLYILTRLLSRLFKKKTVQITDDKSSENINTNNKSISNNSFLKSFPFPPPHGAFKNYIDELKSWSFAEWQEVISLKNKFPLQQSASSQINPILPLFSLFLPNFAIKLHEKTRRLELALGKIPFVKTFSISGIFITRKN